MGIPNVKFEILNGALGGTNPTGDGIAGLILSHEATSELALNTPVAIFSIADAEALLLTGFALDEIKDFYSKAGDGQELWVIIVSDTSLLADICDETNDIAKKLLTQSGGRVKICTDANKARTHQQSIKGVKGDPLHLSRKQLKADDSQPKTK